MQELEAHREHDPSVVVRIIRNERVAAWQFMDVCVIYRGGLLEAY